MKRTAGTQRAQREMTIRERTTWEERRLTVTWEPGHLPPREQVTQASGICFVADGRILLVSQDGDHWALPGGHPEPGEAPEQALIREVWEEASARVERFAYLGAQRVDDPEAPAPPHVYYQLRYVAWVRLEPFDPQHETRHRRLVAPDQLIATLGWDTTAIAEALLAAAQQKQAPVPPLP